MYIYICIFLHVLIYIYIGIRHVFRHMYMYTHIHTYMHIHINRILKNWDLRLELLRRRELLPALQQKVGPCVLG